MDPPASSVVGAPIGTAGGSESSFVMVEEEEQDPDAFESALEAALREGEEGQGTSAAGGGPLIGADADEGALASCP